MKKFGFLASGESCFFLLKNVLNVNCIRFSSSKGYFNLIWTDIGTNIATEKKDLENGSSYGLAKKKKTTEIEFEIITDKFGKIMINNQINLK